MEWCRMFRLRTVLCAVLLWCELTAGVPDIRQDSPKSMSERDRKLQELLKSLESYTTESHQIMPPEQNFSNLNEFWTMAPFLKLPDYRGRVITDNSDSNFEPDATSIMNREDFYRNIYGTQEGVNFLRKKYGPNGLQAARAKFPGVNRGIDDVKKANDHYLKMRNRARCRTPVPQVVMVKSYYPDPSKNYLPRCAWLHRCGDETGCCESDAYHCVPKSIQEVTLHFYSFHIGKHGLSPDSRVEKLLFENHTSCHCQPINDLPRRIVESQTYPLDGEDQTPTSKCRDCPMPFTNRVYKDGRCGCDCFDRQKPCLRIKRGRDALSEIERRCVEANHCHIPDCEYGIFDPATGYCPRRHDEVAKNHPRRPHHSSPHHRWSFLERD